jgi:galactitol-specific phosphotransferase system IIC component
MDFSRFIEGIVSLAQNHVIIVILIALGLIFLMIRKPKLFFSLLTLGLILAGLFYLITNIATSGSEKKSKLIEEKEEQVDSNR